MNAYRIACTVLAWLGLTAGWISVTLAGPAPLPQGQGSNAAAISQLMQMWQARILAFDLPVDDAKNWSRRNMAKFSRLNAERLAIAQRAATLEELELALLEAPISAGSRLDVLMANPPGDIAMMGAHNAAKSSPATSPTAYANLVFTALTPCRILDSRPSQGGTGAWAANSSNLVKIGPYSGAGGGYASGPGAQGGSATSCGLDVLASPGQIAVIMAAVSTVSQAAAGYLTFYPQGSPNPGATSVSQFYQAGYVQTSFVLIPTDLVGTVAASAFTSATTGVIIDVVGYFVQLVLPPAFNGVRHTSDGFMAAGDFRDITLPSVGTLRLNCGANAQSGSVEWRQIFGVNQQYVIAEYGTKGGAPTIDAAGLSGGFGVFSASFPDSPSNDVGRRASLQVITFGGANVITATVSLQTRPSGITSSCFYGMDMLAGT